jgi:hypothetical protein
MQYFFVRYTREYWMIYRGPGFLAVLWFGSSPTLLTLFLSLPVSPVELIDGRRGGGGRGAQSYFHEKARSSINHSIPSGLLDIYFFDIFLSSLVWSIELELLGVQMICVGPGVRGAAFPQTTCPALAVPGTAPTLSSSSSPGMTDMRYPGMSVKDFVYFSCRWRGKGLCLSHCRTFSTVTISN